MRFNKETLNKFYEDINYADFEEISKEKEEIINLKVASNRKLYQSRCTNFLELYHLVCEKLNASSGKLNVEGNNEKIYYLINTVDPDLKYLSDYLKGLTKEEILARYYIFDKRLLKTESAYNKVYNVTNEKKRK